MTRSIAIVVLVSLLGAQTGCATLFTQDRETIAVSSATPGSSVTVNGAPYGQTPAAVSVDKTKTQTIVVTAPDGRAYTCTANATVGVGWVLLDILAGFVPIVIDAATGKWKSLDAKTCHSPL